MSTKNTKGFSARQLNMLGLLMLVYPEDPVLPLIVAAGSLPDHLGVKRWLATSIRGLSAAVAVEFGLQGMSPVAVAPVAAAVTSSKNLQPDITSSAKDKQAKQGKSSSAAENKVWTFLHSHPGEHTVTHIATSVGLSAEYTASILRALHKQNKVTFVTKPKQGNKKLWSVRKEKA